MSYFIALVYFIFTPFSNIKLKKRKDRIDNYSIFKVKLNYVRYWLETIWLTKEGYKNYIEPKVEIINEDIVRRLNKNYSSYKSFFKYLDSICQACKICSTRRNHLL